MASGLCAALTGRTHGCTDQPANVKKTLANSEPSTHGTRASSCSGVVVSFTLAAASRVSKVSRVSRMILATSRSMCFSTLCCTHSNTSLGRAYPLAYFCSAQQYHLDALTLHGGNFPAQRRLQLPDLGLAAFDHLFPLRIRWSERITPCSSKTIPFGRIRNQHKTLDSISYGSGITWARVAAIIYFGVATCHGRPAYGS